MKYFLSPLIIGLIVVAALNIYVDPSSRWWRSEFNFGANWNADQVWVTPLRIEDRKLRIKHIPMLPQVDLLGLGSSRFFNVDSTMFAPSAHFYNSAVNGATVWDYVALWEKFKEEGKIPKHAIIYVDTWNFNKNTWNKYLWITNAQLVQNFLGASNDNITRFIATRDWITGSFYELVDLFSPAVLKVSLEEIQLHLQKKDAKNNYISGISDRPPIYPALKNDGSKLFSIEDEKPKSLDDITNIGRNIGLGGMYVYMMDWETDNTAIRLMDYLLTDMEKHGVDVLLVQPPFQHETYNIMMRRAEYRDIPARYESIIDSLMSSHAHVAYCNAIDPRTASCSETEFMDSAHTIKSCAKKVVSYCLAKVPQWHYGQIK